MHYHAPVENIDYYSQNHANFFANKSPLFEGSNNALIFQKTNQELGFKMQAQKISIYFRPFLSLFSKISFLKKLG